MSTQNFKSASQAKMFSPPTKRMIFSYIKFTSSTCVDLRVKALQEDEILEYLYISSYKDTHNDTMAPL